MARIPRGKVIKVEKAEKEVKRANVKVKARMVRKSRRIETAAGPFLMTLRAG